ncbi:hypothetical protein FB45DRAFT_895264 [Roridomyces roridus]|uniref:Uncharacterized protein n=1 Tax=Roridomyces roridus TaxID=1738132 RepID=A0AAD7G0T3_9AGAR|nr:hypothetical protein FB45DRAFT_895264 [Roridomyces roridus]
MTDSRAKNGLLYLLSRTLLSLALGTPISLPSHAALPASSNLSMQEAHVALPPVGRRNDSHRISDTASTDSLGIGFETAFHEKFDDSACLSWVVIHRIDPRFSEESEERYLVVRLYAPVVDDAPEAVYCQHLRRDLGIHLRPPTSSGGGHAPAKPKTLRRDLLRELLSSLDGSCYLPSTCEGSGS